MFWMKGCMDMSELQELKKILLVGRTECGKTSLADMLTHGFTAYHKTQTITRVGTFIDTPGEYIENPNYYRGVILNSYEADLVIFMNEAGDEETIFPPNFAHSLNREVIGVISKVDSGESLETPRKNLEAAGVSKIFEVSIYDASSLDALRQYIVKEA